MIYRIIARYNDKEATFTLFTPFQFERLRRELESQGWEIVKIVKEAT